MDMDVEAEDETLPSEYRILQWDDGDFSIHEVYFKHGKPFSYCEETIARAETREELEDALAEIAHGIRQAAQSPILSEENDFPGQYRMPVDSMKAWLKRQTEFADKAETAAETQNAD